MPHVFHITFPFEVAISQHRQGEHAPLCTHPIPLSYTRTYHCPTLPGFAFTHQYYANILLTAAIIEGNSPEPFTAVIGQNKAPGYVLAVLSEGLLCYTHPDGRPPETLQPGTVCLARLGRPEYPICFPAGTSRLLVIAVHAAQMAVIGEDFEELTSLLHTTPLTEDIISPPIKADGLLMRRLIKFISPKGITRRKDFNQHLQAHLPAVCSAIKGILRGKGQVHYDQEKFASVIAFIEHEQRVLGRPPELTAVIDYACVSEDKLGRLFHNELGMTPVAYLLARKLEAINVRLLTTSDPVYLIAQQFGYSDSAALNKPFRKYFGLSPAQVRKQQQSCSFSAQNLK